MGFIWNLSWDSWEKSLEKNIVFQRKNKKSSLKIVP